MLLSNNNPTYFIIIHNIHPYSILDRKPSIGFRIWIIGSKSTITLLNPGNSCWITRCPIVDILYTKSLILPLNVFFILINILSIYPFSSWHFTSLFTERQKSCTGWGISWIQYNISIFYHLYFRGNKKYCFITLHAITWL